MTSMGRTCKRAAGLSCAGLLLASLAAVPAGAEDDTGLQQKIDARLKKARLEQQGDIKVSVRDGRATLVGFATSLEAERAALKAARKETDNVTSALQLVVEPRADKDIRKDAEDAILRYVYYTVFDSIDLGVQDGQVLLRGSVREPYRKDDIEERIARVPGVRAIENQIAVQPVSIGDDRLRAELVRKIYGHDLFNQYAFWADPPIRILVDRGHVTLTGYVNSPVEQAVLGSIARGTLAFSVDNQVRLESEKKTEDSKKPTTS